MKRYVVEFIGTFFVVLAASFTENPIAIGLMYMAMLYVGARVSGAHFNPAITQAVLLRGSFATYLVVPYILAQFLGAMAAIGLEYHISGSLFIPDVPLEDNVWLICLLELLLTFVLCYVYLVVRSTHTFKENQLYGIILGFTLVGLASMGGLFNPAIGAAALVLNGLLEGQAVHLGYNLLMYVVCPFIGSALARFAFDYLELPASGQFASIDSAE